ncbi:MAG TPA: 2-C-methyl-D-erythritol 4-phosphate cytidylyltransferase [Bacilli bacterium]|nr:2-C-methyl-D-erythritol 4-phosphate cytidylyltransferase [Bacilli bacterium]
MVTAIVLIAGSGSRVGTQIPKQFLLVKGKPLFLYAVNSFEENPEVDSIVLVVQPEHAAEVKAICEANHISKIRLITEGGTSRQESVLKALKKLKKTLKDDDIVLIHDGARPLVDEKIISENISLAERFDAVETAIASPNTIAISSDGEWVEEVPDRSRLFQVQTPQSFKFDLIYQAHMLAQKKGITHCSDDAQIAIYAGHKVHIAKGSTLNFKITTYEDFSIFKALVELVEGDNNVG